jgi:hypothetical protein
VVDWSVIGTLEDAAGVVRTFEATPLIDLDHDLDRRHHAQSSGEDRLMDLSEAIDCGQAPTVP